MWVAWFVWVCESVGSIGQIVAWVEWVVWIYKILAWVNKFLAWDLTLVWIGVGAKFEAGLKFSGRSKSKFLC